MSRNRALVPAARSLVGSWRPRVTPAGAAGEGYRPALDGVRGLALLAVLAYHTSSHLPGGFLGLDAFFVLSGYLIATLLMREHSRTGRIRLGQFWARRARRLLPALITVVLAVAIVARLIGPVEQLAARRDDLVATLLYYANWHFVWEDEDYFAIYQGVSPLRHAWSLAIEEQFYIVWPLVAVLVLGLVRRGRGRGVLLGAALAGAGTSVALMAAAYDPAYPSRAYFGTDARAHQLLLGVSLALAVALRPAIVRGPRARRLAAWVGPVAALGAVAAVLLMADDDAIYYHGASPAFALAVVIAIWAMEAAPRGPLGTVMSFSWLTWVGRISYGAYLWHWPLVVWLNDARLDLTSHQRQAIQILGTFVIAAASARFLEGPIRSGRLPWVGRSARRLALAAPAALALTLGVIALSTRLTGTDRIVAEAGADISDAPCPSGSPQVEGHAWCERTPARSPESPLVVTAGDSTSRALDPGMTAVAAERGWRYVQAGQGGCPLIPIVLWVPGESAASSLRRRRCAQGIAAMLAAVAERERPDVWIVADRHATVAILDDDGRPVPVATARHDALVLRALRRTFATLTAGGTRVVIMATPPTAQPASCIGAPGEGTCGLSFFTPADPGTARLDRLHRQVAAETPGVTVVSIDDVLCPGGGVCPTLVEGRVARYDSLHFTSTFSRQIVPTIVARAERAGVRFLRRTGVGAGG